MTPGVLGMLLGLVGAVGLILVVTYAPPFRAVRLVDRLAPYVHDTPPPSRLLGTATEPGMLTAARRVFGPVIGDGARIIDKFLGGRAAVRRRLDALGSGSTVEDFRVEQVIWGGLGLLGAVLLAGTGSLLAGSLNVLSAALLCVAGADADAGGGVLRLRDRDGADPAAAGVRRRQHRHRPVRRRARPLRRPLRRSRQPSPGARTTMNKGYLSRIHAGHRQEHDDEGGPPPDRQIRACAVSCTPMATASKARNAMPPPKRR